MFILENECVQREPEGHVDISAAAAEVQILLYIDQAEYPPTWAQPTLHMYSSQSNQHPVDNNGIDFPLGSLGHAPHANM